MEPSQGSDRPVGFIDTGLATRGGRRYRLLAGQNWNRENLERIKAAAVKPLTFAVFGDNRGEHPPVFESLLKEVDRDPSLAFGIHLGDMVTNADLDKYRTFFQEVRLNFHKPLLSVIGNHELYGDRGLELYREIFGPDYYAFQIDRNYFIVVDDAAKEGMDPGQLRWLEAELQKSQAARTRLVFLHVPLFDPRGARITTACVRSWPPDCWFFSRNTRLPTSLRPTFTVTIPGPGTGCPIPSAGGPGPSCTATTRSMPFIIT